jgi:hypothetical protein
MAFYVSGWRGAREILIIKFLVNLTERGFNGRTI